MKEFIDSEKLSPIEIAKNVISLKGLTDTSQNFDAIKRAIIPEGEIDHINQIIKGLEQEDEFAVLCKIMETCDSISKIGQNPIIGNEEIAPDFIVSFRPGCSVQGLSKDKIGVIYNCFIEVKSCKKKKFRISAKDLKARKKFAQRFGMPLVFAIRFTMFEGQCYWILVEANRLETQGRKLDVTDLIGNLSSVLFDDYGLFTHPQLHFVHYYSKAPELEGIMHKDYGVLAKTVVLLPNCDPIEIDENSIIVNAIIDCFDFKTVHVESDNNITAVVSHIGSQMRFLSDMIYRVNNLARNENGESIYDASRIISRIGSSADKPILITRKIVEYAVHYLNSRKLMLFKMGIGDPKEQEKILRSLERRG